MATASRSDARVSTQQWQVPKYSPTGANLSEVFEWSKRNWEEGQGYLQSEPGYDQLEESIRLLSGLPANKLKMKQDRLNYSRLYTSRLKRNLREMVNSLSEIRYNDGFSSDNNDIAAQAELLFVS